MHERHRPVRCCKFLDLRALGEVKSILYVNAEIPHCVLNLCMAKQDLDRSEVGTGLGSRQPSFVDGNACRDLADAAKSQ